MVWRLLEPLGVPLSHEIAEALYVGLVTDTGKFMYENTGPAAHRMAAELLDAGVDSQEIYRHLYENIPPAKLELLSRGLANMQRFDDGALSLSHLSKADYAATGAEEGYSEGVVDHLRALEGTVVAGLVRDLLVDGKDGMRKVSLRASDDRVDVSRIAREQGGGGHRRAAGFTTAMTMDELVGFLRREVGAQLGRPRRRGLRAVTDGVILVDKPSGITSHDVVYRVRRAPRQGRQGRPRRHAGPVRDRAAARARRARHAHRSAS